MEGQVMFRARIGLAAAAVVAGLTVVVALMVGSSLGSGIEQQVRQTTEHAQAAFPALDRLRGLELTNDTARLARDNDLPADAQLSDALAKSGVDEQRKAVFLAIEARNDWLAGQSRHADLIAVVGPNGHVIARNLNPNAAYDEDWKAKYPSIGKALDGVANKDLWVFDDHMYRVGAAPVRSRAGQIAGALLIGYVASVNDAAADREKVGAEVAYFLDGKVHASSFKKQGGESAEEKALASQLFDGPKLADSALAGELGKLHNVKIGGEEYVAAVGPLSGNLTKSRSGFVVLTSLTAARAPFSSVTMWVVLLGVISLLAALGGVVLTSLRFMAPLDHIETGVAEVINGNRDYAFESESPDFEGLANGLNVMIARLLGRPDPTDDVGGDERWTGETGMGGAAGGLAIDEQAPAAQLSPENAALAAEPEEQYLSRTWEEWMAARKQTGEGVEGMTAAAFVAKLRQNEAALRAKYNCRMVRFKVVVKDNQTTLKPVPIA
jgi:hypothetical protein